MGACATNPDLPHSFVSIVERAIDPDPARRFASAGEMDAALGGDEPRPRPAPSPSIWAKLVPVMWAAGVCIRRLRACSVFSRPGSSRARCG